MAVGDFTGVDKSTASRIIRQVTLAIADLRENYIKFPNSVNEIREKQLDFFKIAKFPRVIGALDCTHVRILSPGNLIISSIFLKLSGFIFNRWSKC